MIRNKTILVIAPHPDDEIIGCSGFLLNHLNQYNIKIIYVTNGSFYKLKQSNTLSQLRVDETKKVCSYLNAKPFYLNEKDRFISKNKSIVKKIVAILHESKPEIVLIPHSEDDDSDHRAVFNISMEAVLIATKLFRKDNWSPNILIGYEVWTPLSKYNYIENISRVIDKKKKLINLYHSQNSNMQIDYAIIGLNRYRGFTSGKGKYCEVFKVYSIKEVV